MIKKLFIPILLFAFLLNITLSAQALKENTKFLEKQLQKRGMNYLKPFVQKTIEGDKVNVFFYFVLEKWVNEYRDMDDLNIGHLTEMDVAMVISVGKLMTQTSWKFERVYLGRKSKIRENKIIKYCEAEDAERVWTNHIARKYDIDFELSKLLLDFETVEAIDDIWINK